MRRAPIVLTATVAGVASVLSFQPRQPSLPASTAASTPSSPSTSAASGSSGASRTATGDSVATKYGNVRVRVSVSGGKITAVQALELTGSDPKSAEISSSAEPDLRVSALSKQSGDVDAVSGATYTSAGYAQSLQSGLDKLGFKAPDGSRASLQVPSG